MWLLSPGDGERKAQPAVWVLGAEGALPRRQALRVHPSPAGQTWRAGRGRPLGRAWCPCEYLQPFPPTPMCVKPADTLCPFLSVGRCWHARRAWRGWTQGLSGELGK